MLKRMTRDRYLSDAELRRFMEAVRTRRHVNQPRDYALFAILANTGLRPSEAMALRRRDVFAGARPPWLHVARAKRRHAAAPVTSIYISREVARIVADYVRTLERGERLFAFTKRQSARLFRYYAERAKLATCYRIFSLRHTFGMRLWRFTESLSGVTGDARLIQAIMGHVHLRPSFNYKHVSPERIRRMHDDLSPIVRRAATCQ